MLEDLRGTRPTNDEGFLDHAYLPSFMHNRKRGYARSFGAQVNYQNRRFAGWAKTIGGLRPRLQGVGEGRLSGVHAVHAVRRDAAERAVVRRSRSRPDRQVRPAAWRGATCSWGKNEEALFNDMVRWSLAILEKAGAELLTRAGRSGAQPRAGRLPDGPRPAIVGRQRRLPDARRAESLRRGWQRVPVGVREEPDAHDHGACRARRRTHCRPDAKGVICDGDAATCPEDAGRHRRHVRLSICGRRALRPARAHHAGPDTCARAVRAGVLHAGRVRQRFRGSPT